MDFIRENKGIAIILGLVVALGAAYLLFGSSGGGSSSDSLLTSQSGISTSPISKELLSTLGDLRGIKLDNSVFDEPTFLSLVDFGTGIPPQPLGRKNPFAPLGETRVEEGAGSTR